MSPDLFDRFAAKVRWPHSMTACWPWLAQTNRYGYGCIWAGRKALAHRIAYELFRGPIPAGLHIDHLCRVRHCVNPMHLEAVEKRVNDERGLGPFVPNLLKTACDHGHRFTPENTYIYRNRRHCRACNRVHAANRKARMRRERAS